MQKKTCSFVVKALTALNCTRFEENNRKQLNESCETRIDKRKHNGRVRHKLKEKQKNI